MKALPTGIITLKMIIDNNLVYIDKTGIIKPLVKAIKGSEFRWSKQF